MDRSPRYGLGNPSWFPTLYDSTLNQTMVYQNLAGYVDRYTSSPRVFYIPATGKYTELGSAPAVPTGLSVNNGGSRAMPSLA